MSKEEFLNLFRGDTAVASCVLASAILVAWGSIVAIVVFRVAKWVFT